MVKRTYWLHRIETLWQADKFLPNGMLAFRRQYPQGSNYVVAGDVERPYTRTFNGIEAHFISLRDIGHHVAGGNAGR